MILKAKKKYLLKEKILRPLKVNGKIRRTGIATHQEGIAIQQGLSSRRAARSTFRHIRRNAAWSESNFPARVATDMQAMTQVRRTATRRLKLITLINNNNRRHSRA